jgi:glucuronate isomerase
VPLFMDVHESLPEGASAKDVAEAHMADVKTQQKYGVNYMKYWVDEEARKVFCLVEAPSAEAARTVHQEAHGLVADRIFEVEEGA